MEISESRKREERIKNKLREYGVDERSVQDLWDIIEDVISEERAEAYDNGWYSCQEVSSTN